MKNKSLLILLFCIIVFRRCFAEEEREKIPGRSRFDGNKVFSNFQLNEQLDIPDEFGKLDTTKQDFMMRLSSENIKSLYYARGYFSLDLKMEIKRELFSTNKSQRGYFISIREGERYRFNEAKIISWRRVQDRYRQDDA